MSQVRISNGGRLVVGDGPLRLAVIVVVAGLCAACVESAPLSVVPPVDVERPLLAPIEHDRPVWLIGTFGYDAAELAPLPQRW